MNRRTALASLALAALLVMFVVASTAQAAVTTKTIRYGPFNIPAGSGDPHDHDMMGQTGNLARLNISKPCTNCTIVAIKPNLVYSNGTNANLNTGPMLHHTVFAAQGSNKRDATCGSLGQLGERFFAAGNERTTFDFRPLNYGYKVGSSEYWSMIVDLMNWQTTSKTVYVQLTYTYATGTDSTTRKPVRPVWLDINNCSNSEFPVPVGPSDTHVDWKVSVPGKIIGIGGHIHDHGVNIELTNQSLGGASICNSVAGYGETPEYITPDGRKHVSSMSYCAGDPVAAISLGQTLRLHANYNVPAGHMAIDDAMGIMIAYVNPS